MTEELQQQPTEQRETFSSELAGIEKAASEVVANRELGRSNAEDDRGPVEDDGRDIEIVKLKIDPRDDFGEKREIQPRDAARALSDHRQAKALDRAKFENAVMGEAPEPLLDEHGNLNLNVHEIPQDKIDAVKAAVDRVDALEREHARLVEVEARAARAEAVANAPVEASWNSIANTFAATFPDASHWGGDLEGYATYLRQADPARFQQFVQLDNAALAVKQQAQQQQQRQQFQAAAAHEDARFEAAHPELKNAKVSETLRQGALDYLHTQMGLNDAQINHLYNVTGVLRSAEAQSMLLAATRQHLAKKGIASARPVRRVPPVQRPGTASGRADHAAHDIRALDERLSITANPRDAAKLVAARRRAR